MPNYQDFLKMARERQAKVGVSKGGVSFTRHAEYKMKQYGLSAQRVRTVMRNPKRIQEGVAKDTVAVMQPVSMRRKDGMETWSQEIWVMYVQAKSRKLKVHKVESQNIGIGSGGGIRVISAWRYPGVSPKGNPIPEEILREIEEGSIFEEEGIIG
ncbi:MAG TPA: hypothetical protein VN420_00460 [Candidatus Fimivivens sp.]|nr:hypothetical protein [Candidatus Fimivivens sp.]